MLNTQQPSRTRVWLLAARPKTLPAAVGPVLVGTALAFADGKFAFRPMLAALVGALLLQIGSNFANDYFDFFKGVDTHERMGPTRVTATGLLTPQQVRWGMVVVFGLAALDGIFLILVGGWPILLLGAAAILAALAYTGGPLPYGYYGLGEFFVFLFFGFAAVVGTYYVQTLTVTAQVWLAAVPVGALITAVLVVNNYRDRATDAQAHKRTLAVLLGERGARIEFFALIALAYAAAAVLALDSRWLLLPFLSLPAAWQLVRAVRTQTGRPLNRALAGTARLSLIFSILLSIGFVLAAP